MNRANLATALVATAVAAVVWVIPPPDTTPEPVMAHMVSTECSIIHVRPVGLRDDR